MKTKPMMNQEPEITLYQSEVTHLLEAQVALLHLSVVCSEKEPYKQAADTIQAVLKKFGPAK